MGTCKACGEGNPVIEELEPVVIAKPTRENSLSIASSE
jgi:hypothetical protein